MTLWLEQREHTRPGIMLAAINGPASVTTELGVADSADLAITLAELARVGHGVAFVA